MVEAGCLVGGDVLAGDLRIGIGSMEGIRCMVEKIMCRGYMSLGSDWDGCIY